jgi:hypothetical protein
VSATLSIVGEVFRSQPRATNITILVSGSLFNLTQFLEMCVLSLFRPVLSANSLVDTHECFADWQQSKKIFQKKTARLSPAVQVKGGNALEEGSNSGGLSLVPMFHMEKS